MQDAIIAIKDSELTPCTRVIYVRVKTVYGREAIYPACNASRTFAILTGKKTLSRSELNLIKSLGYSIAHAAQEVL